MAYNKSYVPTNQLSKELLNANIKIVGLMCEKLISNEFSESNARSKMNLDDKGWYDIEKLEENGDKKYVQVKGCTPFFKHNAWTVKKGKTSTRVENIFKADEIYIVSLPTTKRSGKLAYHHPTDSTIIRVFRDKISERDNVLDGDFFLHREDHRHAYQIVRILTDLEVTLFSKYPTSMYS